MDMKTKIMLGIGSLLAAGGVAYIYTRDDKDGTKQQNALDSFLDTIKDGSRNVIDTVSGGKESGKKIIPEPKKYNKGDITDYVEDNIMKKKQSSGTGNIHQNPDLTVVNTSNAGGIRLKEWEDFNRRGSRKPTGKTNDKSYIAEPPDMKPVIRGTDYRDRGKQGKSGDPIDIMSVTSGMAVGQVYRGFLTNPQPQGYGQSIGRWKPPKGTAAWNLYRDELPKDNKKIIEQFGKKFPKIRR